MRICVVGVGRTGGAVAAALVYAQVPFTELVLVDEVKAIATAEVFDTRDADMIMTGRPEERIRTGRATGLFDYCVVCIGESRRSVSEGEWELYQKNIDPCRGVIGLIQAHTYLVVTNPSVAIAEHLSKEFSKKEIIAMGVHLDEVRFKQGFYTAEHILVRKGYTQWGIAAEVINYIKQRGER